MDGVGSAHGRVHSASSTVRRPGAYRRISLKREIYLQ